MTNEEYLEVQTQLTTLAGIARGWKISEMLQMISRAETVGPIVDPTLYRKGMRHLEAIKDLAQAGMAFQRAAERFVKAMGELGVGVVDG